MNTQWKRDGSRAFHASEPTFSRLPAGAYVCGGPPFGEPLITPLDLRLDDLMDFPDTLADEIVLEIERFWTLGAQFRRRGFLHRRGVLVYGPPGCGKSGVVHQVIRRVIDAGSVAFFCGFPSTFVRVLRTFRQIEPDRPCVCVFEDIDTLIEEHGDVDILQWLDGGYQVDRCVNLASTNYPERLDRRIIGRPRRFDHVLPIKPPSAEVRRGYFAQKMPDLAPGELNSWVDLTEGLSFAALAEMVISVGCLGNSLQETVDLLRTMEEEQPSSRDFAPTGMGFGNHVARAKAR